MYQCSLLQCIFTWSWKNIKTLLRPTYNACLVYFSIHNKYSKKMIIVCKGYNLFNRPEFESQSLSTADPLCLLYLSLVIAQATISSVCDWTTLDTAPKTSETSLKTGEILQRWSIRVSTKTVMLGLTGHSRGMCGHIFQRYHTLSVWLYMKQSGQTKWMCFVVACLAFQRKGNKLAHKTWLYCYLFHTLTATYSSWSCGPDHVTRIGDVLSDNVNVGAKICWGVNQPRPCRLTGLFNVYLTEWQMMLINISLHRYQTMWRTSKSQLIDMNLLYCFVWAAWR